MFQTVGLYCLIAKNGICFEGESHIRLSKIAETGFLHARTEHFELKDQEQVSRVSLYNLSLPEDISLTFNAAPSPRVSFLKLQRPHGRQGAESMMKSRYIHVDLPGQVVDQQVFDIVAFKQSIARDI